VSWNWPVLALVCAGFGAALGSRLWVGMKFAAVWMLALAFLLPAGLICGGVGASLALACGCRAAAMSTVAISLAQAPCKVSVPPAQVRRQATDGLVSAHRRKGAGGGVAQS